MSVCLLRLSIGHRCATELVRLSAIGRLNRGRVNNEGFVRAQLGWILQEARYRSLPMAGGKCVTASPFDEGVAISPGSVTNVFARPLVSEQGELDESWYSTEI